MQPLLSSDSSLPWGKPRNLAIIVGAFCLATCVSVLLLQDGSVASPAALLSADSAQMLDMAPVARVEPIENPLPIDVDVVGHGNLKPVPRNVEAIDFNDHSSDGSTWNPHDVGYNWGAYYPSYYPGYVYSRDYDDYDESSSALSEAEEKAAHDAYVYDYYARAGVPPGPNVYDNFNAYPYSSYSPYTYGYGYGYEAGAYPNGWPDIETNYDLHGAGPPAISDLKSSSGVELKAAPGQQLSWENVGWDPSYGKNLHWDTLPGDSWRGPTSGDYQGSNPPVMWVKRTGAQRGAPREGLAAAAAKQQRLKASGLRTTILRPGFFSNAPDALMGEPGGRPEPTEEELRPCPCAGVGGLCLDLLRDEIHDQGPTPCFCNC